MRVMEVSQCEQLARENRRKQVEQYLDRFDLEELREIEDRYAKRRRQHIIDFIMSGNDEEIADIYKGEALDQPFFREGD